jgi:sporulation protein YlmC with PRC-barrel domain
MKRDEAMLSAILLIVGILLLISAVPAYPHSRSWEYYSSRVVGGSSVAYEELTEKQEEGKSLSMKEKYMRQQLTIGILSALIIGGMTVESWAAQAEAYRQMTPSALPTMRVSAQREGTVDVPERGGSGRIQTREGVGLGELKDFLIEPQKGCIAYGIISLTGSPPDEPMVLFPWNLVKPDPADPTVSSFRLQVEHELLRTAPRLSRDQWAHASVAEWISVVEPYWGKNVIQHCAVSTTTDTQVIKASDIVGMNIRRDSGEEVGTIRELIMDGDRGTIVSAIVAQEDLSMPSLRIFFTLPWKALYLNTSDRTFVVRLSDSD